MPGRRPNPYAGAINSTSRMLYQMAMQKMEHRQMLERQRERREDMARRDKAMYDQKKLDLEAEKKDTRAYNEERYNVERVDTLVGSGKYTKAPPVQFEGYAQQPDMIQGDTPLWKTEEIEKRVKPIKAWDTLNKRYDFVQPSVVEANPERYGRTMEDVKEMRKAGAINMSAFAEKLNIKGQASDEKYFKSMKFRPDAMKQTEERFGEEAWNYGKKFTAEKDWIDANGVVHPPGQVERDRAIRKTINETFKKYDWVAYGEQDGIWGWYKKGNPNTEWDLLSEDIYRGSLMYKASYGSK